MTADALFPLFPFYRRDEQSDWCGREPVAVLVARNVADCILNRSHESRDVRTRCRACARPANCTPVIVQLARLLDSHRGLSGNPANGLMFVSPVGKPVNLDALAANVIVPLVTKAGVQWHG